MDYHFDEVIDRRGTHSHKWEFMPGESHAMQYGDHTDQKYGSERFLPLWVADMDFRTPPAVVEALVERARDGIFGYSSPADSYFEALTAWFRRRYGRQIQREWVIMTPGIVPALNMLVQTFVAPGEKVLIQRPVYHPFTHAAENNGAEVVSNSLVLEGDCYRMDFADLARKAADPAVKIALLCSPHNPVARVWSREELAELGRICLENDVLVVSDEAHCDLIFPGQQFTSFASLGPEYEAGSIICTAPSKSFNLAGLKLSNILIPDEQIRSRLHETIERNGLLNMNVFGIVATEAAYRHGDDWLAAVMDYVAGNYRFMVEYLTRNLPQIVPIPMEGTYLAWVDFRALGLENAARKALIRDQARLLLNEGEKFGPEGAGFERINIACPRSILQEALERLQQAVGNG